MKKLAIVAATAMAVAAITVSAKADVTDFTHHLKRQGVNKYKLIRPDINTYKHINIKISIVEGRNINE